MCNVRKSYIICCNKSRNMHTIQYSVQIQSCIKANFIYTGEFGIVYRALCTHKSGLTGVPQPVAVKTLKGLLFT